MLNQTSKRVSNGFFINRSQNFILHLCQPQDIQFSQKMTKSLHSTEQVLKTGKFLKFHIVLQNLIIAQIYIIYGYTAPCIYDYSANSQLCTKVLCLLRNQGVRKKEISFMILGAQKFSFDRVSVDTSSFISYISILALYKKFMREM